MNRAARRANAAMTRQLQPSRPKVLTQIPPGEVRERLGAGPTRPLEVWQSREFLVQVFGIQPAEGQAPCLRLTVCRVTLRSDGRADDGITWDELQRVKSEVGRGHLYAVEVYPPARYVVNVANMRHLWLFQEPLDCGWNLQRHDQREGGAR